MKKRFQQKVIFKRLTGLVLVAGILVLGAGVAVGAYIWHYSSRVYPGISVSGTSLGDFTFSQASNYIKTMEKDYLENKGLEIDVVDENGNLITGKLLNLKQLGVEYETDQLINRLAYTGRDKGPVENLITQFNLRQEGMDVDHIYSLNEAALNGWVDKVAQEVDVLGERPKIIPVKNGSKWTITVDPGKQGKMLNRSDLELQIRSKIGKLSSEPEKIILNKDLEPISQVGLIQIKAKAEKLINSELPISLDVEKNVNNWKGKLAGKEMVDFLDFDYGWNEEKIYGYTESLAKTINSDPVNAKFRLENDRVLEFQPSVKGIGLQTEQSVKILEDQMELIAQGEEKVEAKLPVILTEPSIKTLEVNDLGINEVIGHGESNFAHSIPGRVHNVALTASRINGVLIAPGESFSFNQTLGEVSAKTGYKPAYIIQQGRTVLGDGGGVCQVSTTLFRAVLDTGLPINERRAHAYRVSYYELNSKPGYDATVYAPSPDLKFVNDTANYILIQTKTDTKNLTLDIDLYGTKDGRKAEIINYKSWDAVGAPAPVYQDDPTLPKGTVKQIDWAAPGLKVKFDYVVTKDGGKPVTKTFTSVYQPWRAVYLNGTKE
jgi:vancomycin resistance protein YoaR